MAEKDMSDHPIAKRVTAILATFPLTRFLHRLKPRSHVLLLLSSLLLIGVSYRTLSAHRKHQPVVHQHKTDRSAQLILITGYQRSGSSFVGDLMQQADNTFYFFEPLTGVIGGSENHPNEPMSKISQLMHRFMDCSFPRIPGYMRFLKGFPWHLKQMGLLMSRCRRLGRKSCLNPDLIHQTCMSAKRRVIKSFYVPMRRMDEFLQTLSPDDRQEIRILYLVRDPRAMMASLRERTWCSGRCLDPRRLCHEMNEDVRAFFRLKKELGDRLSLMRYEDMARFPDKVALQLFERLGLPFTPGITKYVMSHTQVKLGDPVIDMNRLMRNARDALTHWVKRITSKDVQAIQSTCAYTMRLLKYSIVDESRFPIKEGMQDTDSLFGEVGLESNQGLQFLL